MDIKKDLRNIINESLSKMNIDGVSFIVEVPKNKENGDYNAENREFIKSIKMMEKLNEYDYVILLDDDHKILKRTLNEVGKNGEVFHVSSATM